MPTNTTAVLNQGAITIATNLRAASLSIAAYDYALTLPIEYRLYKSTKRDIVTLILFILIRYCSIMVLVSSNVGFFYHHFSPQFCRHYYRLTPILKLAQLVISQGILGLRTYGISKNNRRVLWTIMPAFFIVVGFQSFSAEYGRIPVMVNGNCMISNSHPRRPLSNWAVYLAAVLYDCLVLSIATIYLFKLGTTVTKECGTPKSERRSLKQIASALARVRASQSIKTLLYGGLGYLVALTAVNVTNMFLFRKNNVMIQSSGASLSYAVTWIMTQRILLHPLGTREPPPGPPSALYFAGQPRTRYTDDGPSSSGIDARPKERESIKETLSGPVGGH